jgi:aminoglycoside phosphotransferase (APT) family kinase protein
VRYEPPINHAHLIETVRDVYGLPVQELVFVPVGVPSVCYAVHCGGEERYFLKLWPDTRTGRANAARRTISLPLTRALYERGLYPRVPYPISTRNGALWATFSGNPFAVFPLLSGHAPPARWSPALRDEFARTIAAIHRATPALADVLPPHEAFDIPFEDDLRHGLEAIEQIGPRERPGLRALRDMVLPRRAEILVQLARLHLLQHAVRQLSGPFVLCHTDMGGDNLLVDDHGQLIVLDWDDAIVAPPEHDLQSALGEGFGYFLETYEEAGGQRLLHVDHFAFYLLRRYVHDMAVRLLRILEENTSEEQDEDALEGMEAYGFAQWSALDETLDGIAAALRHSTRTRFAV